MPTANKLLIVIAGPTAVGKTALAIRAASALKTEIISADSRQFYREMTIGTAKPSPRELEEIPHHFINSHTIRDDYDAAAFSNDALKTVSEILKRNDSVILCGGSGLYIRAVCEGFDDIPDVPGEIREDLVRHYEHEGLTWLQNKMQEVDPDYTTSIDMKNPHRLIRAIEVKLGTGKSISVFRMNKKREHPFRILKLGLELPREELYQRIELRVDQMIRVGLFEEATSLYPYRAHNALQTVGYQEIFDYIEKKTDRDETIRLLKQNTRRYAKRQLTWFKKDKEFHWFNPMDIETILSFIKIQMKG